MTSDSLSRRHFLRLAGGAAGAALLAACTPPPAPAAPTTAGDSQETPQAQPPSGDAANIRMWYWDTYMADGYKPIIDAFHQENPNVNVVIEMTDYGEYSQKVAASIAGGSPPEIVGAVAEHFTNLAGQDLLTDLKPLAQSTGFDLNDYLKGNLSQNTWGDKLVSLPFTSDSQWVFYHVDKFKEKGVETPYDLWKKGEWNWDTMMSLAEQFTEGEGVDKHFGFGGFSVADYFMILAMIGANEGDFFDAEYTKCQLLTEPVMDVYKWGYDMRKYSPGPSDTQLAAPQSGRIAMWYTWSPFGLLWKEQTNFPYSYAPFPASPKTDRYVYTGDAPGFGIVKGVKYTDESWLWLQRISQDDAATTVFKLTGQEPPRKSIALKSDLWMGTENFVEAAVGLELTKDRMEGGYYYNTPKVSNFLEMWNAHGQELTLTWSDSQSLEEALTKINTRVDELLQEATIDKDTLLWNS